MALRTPWAWGRRTHLCLRHQLQVQGVAKTFKCLLSRPQQTCGKWIHLKDSGRFSGSPTPPHGVYSPCGPPCPFIGSKLVLSGSHEPSTAAACPFPTAFEHSTAMIELLLHPRRCTGRRRPSPSPCHPSSASHRPVTLLAPMEGASLYQRRVHLVFSVWYSGFENHLPEANAANGEGGVDRGIHATTHGWL